MTVLTGKIAFVTGGAAGMGAAIVREFAQEGATVYLGDVDREQGENIASECGAHFIYHDVSSEPHWRKIIDRIVNEARRIDILVNNAGIAENSTVEDGNFAQWRRSFAINTDGVFYGCHNAIRAMKSNPGGSDGSIVNIVSTSAHFASAGQVAYGPSKAATLLLTKSIGLHCAQSRLNIRCNAILPGATHTRIVDRLLAESENPEETLTYLNNISPMGRMALPGDIASAALFLASDQSSYINASEIIIDGGATSRHPGL